MGKILFAGSGAEVDLGFQTGGTYIVDTFFTKKPKLYDALEVFYKKALISRKENCAELKYGKHFLFACNGIPFIQLLENIIRDDPDYISELLDEDLEVRSLADIKTDNRKELFKCLIIDKERVKPDSHLGEFINRDDNNAYFGVLEPLFSTILHPASDRTRFWKLINFYWSAFFSIVYPFIKVKDMGESLAEIPYSDILDNLEAEVKGFFSDETVNGIVSDKPQSYCATLGNLFDYVLTTNYTPFSRFFSGGDDKVAYLAGKLSTFENADTLDVVDICSEKSSDKSFLSSGLVFPYMMGQAPIKPIISRWQLDEYRKALDALNTHKELYMLGYSLPENDGHIISLIRDYLCRTDDTVLHYFKYAGDENAPCVDDEKEKLTRKLRIFEKHVSNRIIVHILSGKSCDMTKNVRSVLEM